MHLCTKKWLNMHEKIKIYMNLTFLYFNYLMKIKSVKKHV